jgi:poly(A) polymerase/tRNA nucleotidyltransferase (CCA-adding enzyme)
VRRVAERPSTADLDARLASVLPPGSLYAVGGRVRDELRSALDGIPRPASDLDYVAVGIGVSDLIERLQRIGRADLVGASFAVVKCTIDGVTVDVALPRRERSTGTSHRAFEVESGPAVSLADDLARRDFRMNMLARALPAGTLVDPYGGAADIEARRIDLLRLDAFREDPLRMLRACQFAARFEYRLSERTFEALRDGAPLAATVSAERSRDELLKLLSADRPSLGFRIMHESGLLAVLLPEVAEGAGVEQNEYHAYDVLEHSLSTLDAADPGDRSLRLAALLHDVAKPRTKDGPRFYGHEVIGERLSAEILERLRFPAEAIETVSKLVREHMFTTDAAMTDAGVRRFIRRVGIPNIERLFALRAADIAGSGLPKRDDSNEVLRTRVRSLLEARPPLAIEDLRVSGEDAIAALAAAGKLPAGSKGGPAVGRLLRAVLERVMEDPKLDRADQMAALANLAAEDVSRGT